MQWARGQAKPGKKAKVIKPAEEPKAHEPEQQTPASDTSMPPPREPVHDVPPEVPDLSNDPTNVNPLSTESSSPIKPSGTPTDDVVITGTGFKEPGQPTVLAKHSAKEELIER